MCACVNKLLMMTRIQMSRERCYSRALERNNLSPPQLVILACSPIITRQWSNGETGKWEKNQFKFSFSTLCDCFIFSTYVDTYDAYYDHSNVNMSSHIGNHYFSSCVGLISKCLLVNITPVNDYVYSIELFVPLPKTLVFSFFVDVALIRIVTLYQGTCSNKYK